MVIIRFLVWWIYVVLASAFMGLFFVFAGLMALGISTLSIVGAPLYLIPMIGEIKEKWPWEKKDEKTSTTTSADDDDYQSGTDGRID